MTPLISIHEILLPTDLSPEAECAFDQARFLAERFKAHLTLYHAVEVPDHRFAHWAFAHGHQVWRQAEAEAQAALSRRGASLGVQSRVVVERTASAHRAVAHFIRSEKPDLTVMATHGRTGLAHLLLGSVTEEVVQQVYRPVLAVRECEHAGSLPYRRILVPTDLSLASRLAFPMAAFLARTFEAELIGVHVVPNASVATLSGIPQPLPPVIPSEAALWKFFQADFDGLPLTAQVDTGSVWERILHVARVEKADLVVMSTRGHDSLADRIVGSTTERVLRHAPCPVLVA